MPLERSTLQRLALLLGLVTSLVACGPSPEQQRQATEREQQQRQAQAQLERCRRNQADVKRLTTAINRHTSQLGQVNAARYEPLPRPEPPDPALAARFTQADQELDELRYRDRLRAWEESEQQRYGRWLDEQTSRRNRLRTQLENDANLLRRIAPELMAAAAGSAVKPEAVARASRCSPVDFGLQESAAAGNSSKAAAN